LFVAQLVEVFREVRRVLRDDGTLWLNLGDSYAATTRGAGGNGKQHSNKGSVIEDRRWQIADGLKPKDLCGIPWRVAFALQEDGWYLRQDIIWSKPNAMPESALDRPARAHEYIFLLSKSQRYFYDTGATSVRLSSPNIRSKKLDSQSYSNGSGRHDGGRHFGNYGFARKSISVNGRSVWTLSSQPMRGGGHYAAMPLLLARICVGAGSRRGDAVLDPFSGAATTGLAALGLGRRYVGIELNHEYAELSRMRLANELGANQEEMTL
jgi:DNA modification methylase